MAYMIPHGEPSPNVDLNFIVNRGVRLNSVVSALQKGKHNEIIMGYAVEVKDADSRTRGYLIYVPFTLQAFVDDFFNAQEEGK